jgi:hypothetical protein
MNRRRPLAFLGVALVLGAFTAAAAKPVPPKPKAKPDAGADEILTIPSATASASGTAPATTATAEAPPVKAELYDGGVRPSPLNPAQNEFPPVGDGGAVAFDYDRLLADVAALRARVAAAGDALFRSKIAIQVKTDGKHARIGKLTVSLDDGTVYTAPNGFSPDDWAMVYEHSLAPGRHAVTVDVERKDDRDESFRTAQRSRVTVEVPKEQRLELQVLIADDSTMGGDFPGDRSGRYDLRVRFKANAKAMK